jgi:hypothetical protein
MDEGEWLKGEDPQRMLNSVRRSRKHRASERKFRMFAVACCRRLWLVMDTRSRETVEIAERLAGGELPIGEVTAAYETARQVVRTIERDYGGASASAGAARAAAAIVDPRRHYAEHAAHHAMWAEEWAWTDQRRAAKGCTASRVLDRFTIRENLNRILVHQAALLRCIMGNPFKPVSPGPWITPAAVTVAQDIYDRRDFTALPLLADLLEEAGCPEQSVLDHCRGPGEHARGCHVVDMVLGKG